MMLSWLFGCPSRDNKTAETFVTVCRCCLSWQRWWFGSPRRDTKAAKAILTACRYCLSWLIHRLRQARPNHTYKEAIFRNRRARRKYPNVSEEPTISGRLQNTDVSAFPDTGAAANFISLPYAQRNGITIEKDLRRRVTVGDGSKICVVGTTTLPFSFAGEKTTHDLTFHVLQRSVHDVILGSSFLRASKTFTQFAHRVGRKVRESAGPGIYRVHFLGSQQYVKGMANGVGVNAVPDTGADVSVMSAKFAKASGFKVNDDERNRISLGFADGSTARARGVVKGVAWRFGANDQECLTDVYVLSSLPVDLVLGYDFLCQTEAFLEHERDFWHDDDLERENACWRLCIIRRLEGMTKCTGEKISGEYRCNIKDIWKIRL
jgi:predicted aspartyl protease